MKRILVILLCFMFVCPAVFAQKPPPPPHQKIPCSVCHGQGIYECNICHGEKHIETICKSCAGIGEINFILCQTAICEYCVEGIVPDTKEKCNICFGTGKVTECKEIKEKCSNCDGVGTKSEICESCNGQGKIVCRTCSGKGFI